MPAGSARRRLSSGDAADADRADLALVAQGDHLGELVVEVDDLIALGLQAGAEVEASQVHHVDAVDAELREIGLDRGAQFGGPLRGGQRNAATGRRSARRPC